MSLQQLVLIVFVLIAVAAVCFGIKRIDFITEPWKTIIIILISLVALWWLLGELGLLPGGGVGHTRLFR